METHEEMDMDESNTYEVVDKQIDSLIASGHLPSAGAVNDWVEEKTRPGSKSKLDIRGVSHDLAYSTYFRWVSGWVKKHGEIMPEYGTVERDVYLSKIWRAEPILAGAVYSMAAKMVSLKWQVIGGRNLAIYYSNLLSRTAYMGGYGWGGFSSASAQDFYTTNNGTFWESPRTGSPMYGKLADLGHIDSLLCTLTGNTKRPVHYVSDTTGQSVRFRNGEVIHFASMNSPREEHLGIGFCAVDRALKAAKLLLGLHTYDSEKLANLPPEGVAAVTGLTMDEFQDALAMWQSARAKDHSLTFPQVLWLIGSQPNATVSLDFIGFSQLPESFDRSTVVTQYVNTLALDFGVDAREFWPVSSGALGTVGETEVQHMKAKGKGHGEYVSITERVLNDEMPDGVEFGYDTQDMEEDKSAAEVAKAWIAAYLPLTVAGGAAEEILSKDELMRLLADKDVIPDWMVKDDRVVADDMGVHEKQWTHDNVICIEWDGRVLKQKRGPTIDLSYRLVGYDGSFIEAEVLKGGEGSGHRGHAGRPGSVGGSVPSSVAMSIRTGRAAAIYAGWVPPDPKQKPAKTKTDPGLQHTQVVAKADEIKQGKLGKGYFVRPDDSLVDVTSDYGGGTNDHVGYIVATENPEILGLDRGVIGRFIDLNDALYVDEIWEWDSPEFTKGEFQWMDNLHAVWNDIADKGHFRVREFTGPRGRNVSMDLLPQTHSNFKRIQNLVATGVITSDKTTTYSWDGSGKGDSFLQFSWRDLMTAGSVRDLRYASKEHDDSHWQQVDAATEFLKQADATLVEEPKRNIRGKPVPEDEALRGSKITQTAIEAEMELWRKHPLLSQYMTEGAGES